MATVSESGWPCVQHRGGPLRFLWMLDDTTGGLPGNRQYISVGNVDANERPALFLMDYSNRRRLKIYAHAE
jgi:predicted pyridoxine 5'-phosphate oxidase superfamily flavin-nucleotide-binding protein